MKKILLATVAILAFAAPSFAQDKTICQAPPSAASSFYLAQDTGTMKCQVVNAQPAAGGNMKVIGAAHPTQAEAQTALAADKTCK
jgi:ABC-type sugar transport system substrate-binding protein